MTRTLLVALVIAVSAAGCRRTSDEAPPAAQDASPPGLEALVAAERRLLDCLKARADRVAAALEAGSPFPSQEPGERACLDSGVQDVLASPAPPRPSPPSAWQAALDELQHCRGELAFAVVTPSDLRRLAETESPAEQAEWLRTRTAGCGAALRALQGPAGGSG